MRVKHQVVHYVNYIYKTINYNAIYYKLLLNIPIIKYNKTLFWIKEINYSQTCV